MKTLLHKFWPFILIILAVLIFFYPVWLKNQIPLPADLVVGAYYPWLDYNWGYPSGVPVKNPITSDAVSFFYPMRQLSVNLLKQGQFPLWNPLILGGTPLLANFQSAPFSPTIIFYFFSSQIVGWTLQIITQVILAAFFMYLLLREFQRSRLAALAGGLFFGFSGFLIIWLEWNVHSLVAAFFPLIIFLTLKWLRTQKVKWGLLLSLGLALQIFSGYPQIIIYEFLILALEIFIFDSSFFKNPKRMFLYVLFILVGFAIAAAQILPGLELIKESQRSLETLSNEMIFVPWQSLLMLLAPDYFGNQATYNYWGPAHYTVASGYSGLVVLVLSFLGFLKFRKEKAVFLALSMVALVFLIGFENPLSLFLRQNILGLQASSNQRILLLFNLAAAIMASFGIDALSEKMSWKKVTLAIAPFFLILAVTGTVTYYLFRQSPSVNLIVGLKNLILPAAFLAICTTLLFLNFKFKKLSKVFICCLIILSLAELFRFGWKYTPFSNQNLVFPETPIIQFLQNQPEPFRVVASKVIPTNFLMPYNLQTLEGYDAVYPQSSAQFVGVLDSGSVKGVAGRYGSVNNLDSNLLNLANVEYVVVLKTEKFDTNKFEKVFEDRSVVVLKNKNYLPRVKMFYDWKVLPQDLSLEKLLDKNFPYQNTITLENSPNIESKNGVGAVDLSKFNQGIINGQTNSPGMLYIANTFYPGWQASVNGQKVDIIKADANFMAVPIKTSGNFAVKLSYQPKSFQTGLWVSLISLGAVLLLLTLSFKERIRI